MPVVQADILERIKLNAAEVDQLARDHWKAGRVLCRCDKCAARQPDKAIWERTIYINRGTAYNHMRAQRARSNLQSSGRRGRNADHSYWNSEQIVAAMKREVMAALGAETAGTLQIGAGKYRALAPTTVWSVKC